VHWIELSHDKVQLLTFVNTVMNLCIPLKQRSLHLLLFRFNPTYAESNIVVPNVTTFLFYGFHN
jgi:hypothetical protein